MFFKQLYKKIDLSKIYFLILPFLFIFLQADPSNSEFSLGARSDNIQLSIDSLKYSNTEIQEKWSSIKILQLSAEVETTIYNHFYLRAHGNYGFVLDGTKFFDLNIIDTFSDTCWLTAKTKGNVYDIFGAIGYISSFFFNQLKSISLIGYSCSVQSFNEKSYLDTINLVNFFENKNSSCNYQWIGPWIGICFSLEKFFKTFLEYQFHWSFYQGKIHNTITAIHKTFQKKNGSYGNEFTLKISSPKWKTCILSLAVNYKFYYILNEMSFSLKNKTWNSGSISVNVKKQF